MLKKIYTAIFLFLFCANLQAKNLEQIFEDWHVLTTLQEEQKICYMVSVPKEESGNFEVRAEAYLLVSKFKDREAEVSISSGFPYKIGGEVEFKIDDKSFNLRKIEDNLAWAESSKLDQEIIAALKSGNSLNAKGTAEKGQYAIDTYSLMGFTNAYNKMMELCK